MWHPSCYSCCKPGDMPRMGKRHDCDYDKRKSWWWPQHFWSDDFILSSRNPSFVGRETAHHTGSPELTACFCEGSVAQPYVFYLCNILWNIVLWKESVDSDDQQFHQYQQNEHPSLTLKHWTQKYNNIGHLKSMSRDRHKHVAMLNRSLRSQSTVFHSWISNKQ